MAKKNRIFVVDDDEWYREYLSYTLSLNSDNEVLSFENGATCLANLVKKPSIITLDYRLPDIEGKKLLEQIKTLSPDTEVIVISEQDQIEVAVDLLKCGAFDYIVKTKDVRQRLLNVVSHIDKQNSLKKRVSELEKVVESQYKVDSLIIGNSPEIKKIFHLIQKATLANIVVLITGETGTGKELVAKAIHYTKFDKKKPFIAVNMAAIPSELIESELFGHEKGAFTGAVLARKGKFEEAKGGTLFLDEIGELDLPLQAKLLRVLQEKEFTKVGSNQSIKTECRIVAATNKNLLDEVRKGNFREDLYFRLYGITIDLPPLRERGGDILSISKHLIEEFSLDNSIKIKVLSKKAQKKLLEYNFPGNVRELKSMIELAVVMSDTEVIEEEDINFISNSKLSNWSIDTSLSLKEHTENIILTYLKENNNNVKLTADQLSIGFATIYRLLKRAKE